MPRCPRAALDYFPIDTSWNLKMRLLVARFGLDGLGAVIQLEQMIFREGYSCRWSHDAECLFIMENSTTKERIEEVLEYCLANGIFDRNILMNKGVLTSRDIQLQWLKICEISRRKSYSIAPELDLTTKQYEFEDLKNDRSQEENQDRNPKAQKNSERMRNDSEKSGEIPHSLSKENEIKEKESIAECDGFNNTEQTESPLMRRLLQEVEITKKKAGKV